MRQQFLQPGSKRRIAKITFCGKQYVKERGGGAEPPVWYPGRRSGRLGYNVRTAYRLQLLLFSCSLNCMFQFSDDEVELQR